MSVDKWMDGWMDVVCIQHAIIVKLNNMFTINAK